ncbi:MAG: hypothetical protein FP825_16765 [Hyphomonas sp.]|uniref:type II secretion system protein GspL n=1 Tax=Hyphomonas sp. TaxID=87 RepID=UPI0017B928FD|nr:type II secretion system protein GspL [Hyphomonas sp.]MBU3922261.1 hypothetical protein [Alphaproteobacteria bacterium]MBA3070123.1 hypothetical protein [Hyphomonas sp.]MBU4060301.1 hypothetical protein [Alphaproteobacteria bacterium]MBU4162969.1 hypothetical protein [Alphaproteobacteria bacterium]MBU4567454.1 hypothetical protein [Alphaproteobacteria bacterium]
MKADLYLELPANPDLPVRLARVRNHQLETITPPELKPGARLKTVAFAPALAAPRFSVSLPARSESEARKAALFAIEDDLAQPVEDVALTLGPRTPAGMPRDVYVVDRALLKSWLALIQSLGLDQVQIIPESSLITPDTRIHDFGARLVLSGPDRTIGADADLPEDVFRALISSAGLENVPTTRGDALTTLARLHEDRPGVSLDGPGGEPARSASSRGYRAWFTAAALAFAVAALWIAGVWLETRNLQAAATAQEDNARRVFTILFAGAPEPADLGAEVRRLSQRAEAAPAGGFLPLASAVYAAISGSDTIQLARLSWSSSDQALNAKLHFANRADESSFHTRLQTAGLVSETVEASDTLSGVDASITVRVQP